MSAWPWMVHVVVAFSMNSWRSMDLLGVQLCTVCLDNCFHCCHWPASFKALSWCFTVALEGILKLNSRAWRTAPNPKSASNLMFHQEADHPQQIQRNILATPRFLLEATRLSLTGGVQVIGLHFWTIPWWIESYQDEYFLSPLVLSSCNLSFSHIVTSETACCNNGWLFRFVGFHKRSGH